MNKRTSDSLIINPTDKKIKKEEDSIKPRVVKTMSAEKHQELLNLIRNVSSEQTEDGCIKVPTGGRFSTNKKGYIQIKVKTPNNSADSTPPNMKVQLHQLVAWNHPDETERSKLQQAITEGTMEISHLCPNKNCANPQHLCAEDSYTNKTRWGCMVVIYINEKEYPCCKHKPHCVPSPELRNEALRYTVN